MPEEVPKETGTIDDEELEELVKKLHINIKIIGCGGGGSNTVNRCSEAGIFGAQKCALNTDARHLLTIHADRKILIGRNVTKGLGAGADPLKGERAAKESEHQIRELIQGSHIVFITAGMGGGTGTGAAPLVAKIAKELGVLTIGIVTLPFTAEGKVRMDTAIAGIENLKKCCDTTIVIPNDKLLELVPKLSIEDAFTVADQVLMEAIKGITEIVTKPGLVNIDYSDIETIMKDGGVALIGLGESDDAVERVNAAVDEALNSPLLGDLDLSNARGALVRVTGGHDMTILDAEKAAELINEKINKTARLIWGCSVDPSIDRTIKIMLIVTGVKYQF